MHQPKLDLSLPGVGAVGGQIVNGLIIAVCGIAHRAEGSIVAAAVQAAIRATHFAGAAQVIRKQIIQLVRAADHHAHGHPLSTGQVVELPRHAGQVGIAGRRGGGRACVGCRRAGGARLGDGTRPRGRVRMRAGARRGGRGCLSEVRREGLYDHCFGVGLGLGNARGGFGRRARARGRVGLSRGGRAGWGAGLGRRQGAGAAGHRRA